MLINGWFLHCYLSTEVLKGTINPTVKDYKRNITEAANYRPVMQSSCILKLIEQHILYILSEKISVNCRQFGFQAGTSTVDACFLLKEVMAKYSKCKQHGYLTFIDLSKAFDLVDHYKLGFKLIEREIPIDIIYFIMHYMRNQVANVSWKDATSEYSLIESGVRQGGILSPFLFKFYIDSIIDDISLMREGCILGITKINILAYADDLVLLSVSLPEMEKLYQKLCSNISKHSLQINISKIQNV